MQADLNYYGRFVFFSFITLQALKSDVHSSCLNLHDYLQPYIFLIEIYFQTIELIAKLFVLYKSPQPITRDVAFKAVFSLNTEFCLISEAPLLVKRNRRVRLDVCTQPSPRGFSETQDILCARI